MKLLPVIIIFIALLSISLGTFGIGIYIDFFSDTKIPNGKMSTLYIVSFFSGIAAIFLAFAIADEGNKKT